MQKELAACFAAETEEIRRIQRRKGKAKSWILECVEFWECKVYEGDIGCDWSEADVRCWRCGHLRTAQKCHIVPKSLGGSDDPSNIIPLCAPCHDEMPNVRDKSEVWRWIKSDHGEIHDTYWTLRAFKQSGLEPDQLASVDVKRLESLQSDISLHFGQLAGRCNLTPATLAWALRKATA